MKWCSYSRVLRMDWCSNIRIQQLSTNIWDRIGKLSCQNFLLCSYPMTICCLCQSWSHKNEDHMESLLGTTSIISSIFYRETRFGDLVHNFVQFGLCYSIGINCWWCSVHTETYISICTNSYFPEWESPKRRLPTLMVYLRACQPRTLS